MNEALLYWGLVLIGVSVLLIVLEGLIPSAGLLGIGAAAAAIAGVGLLFRYETVWGVIGLTLIGVLGPLAFIGALKMLPNTPIGRAILNEVSEEERAERELAEREHFDRRRALIGLRGVVISDMRPVGEIEIEGQTFEALAESSWIEAGAPIEVVGATGLEIIVRDMTREA